MPKQLYCVWLDNLFINHNLMALLQKKDYGATGICRANSGVVQDLIDKKNTKKPKTFFLEKVFSKQLAVTIKYVSLHGKTMDWFFSKALYIQKISNLFNISKNVLEKYSQNPKQLGCHLVTRLGQSFLY